VHTLFAVLFDLKARPPLSLLSEVACQLVLSMHLALGSSLNRAQLVRSYQQEDYDTQREQT